MNERFRGNGYMTETVHAISKWALEFETVFKVIAVTNDNEKSEHTLQNAGFRLIRSTDNSKTWQYE